MRLRVASRAFKSAGARACACAAGGLPSHDIKALRKSRSANTNPSVAPHPVFALFAWVTVQRVWVTLGSQEITLGHAFSTPRSMMRTCWVRLICAGAEAHCPGLTPTPPGLSSAHGVPFSPPWAILVASRRLQLSMQQLQVALQHKPLSLTLGPFPLLLIGP